MASKKELCARIEQLEARVDDLCELVDELSVVIYGGDTDEQLDELEEMLGIKLTIPKNHGTN